ncbi:DUF3581 domain-containing protein [Litchfieldella xinjiangensis]|uniref:DUF3581 domain-containing protein n=1 Tax=Litchfieldella xinjiangensis TaxID=1166948 RepID=UPI0005BE8993|nr:DUF3581 domain-containing protein [Halomonas xinjiangensis]
MYLDEFFTRAAGRTRISAEQASRFAKQVAGDYNPIHNPDARRFCVPGDLLFALMLSRFGLSQRMSFRFLSMVSADVALDFVENADGSLQVVDDNGKTFLEVEREGEVTHDPQVVENFARRYVAFSGRNFPHYLKPLMEAQGVMFNPQRPLVIYDSMGFSMERLDAADPGLELTHSQLEVNGKRGDVTLEFDLTSNGNVIGHGSKKLVVSGLRDYDADAMDAIVEEFYRLKAYYETTA